jgi:hypothetical protein
MEVHRFTTHLGLPLEPDLCDPCQGMWIDRYESLELAPDVVVELFRPLEKTFDVVRRGRYITHRCAEHHERFSSFSSFMVEKGFVRHMTRPEIDDFARREGATYCTRCGAAVGIRKRRLRCV